MKRPLLFLAVAFALMLAGCSETQKAKDFTVVELTGEKKQVTLESFRGKPVLVDFWATWCVPCIANMPEIQKLHDEFGPKGLTIMAVTSEDRQVVEEFKSKSGYTYPVYLDEKGYAMTLFEANAYPHVVLIDGEGNVVLSGHPAELAAEIRQEVERLTR